MVLLLVQQFIERAGQNDEITVTASRLDEKNVMSGNRTASEFILWLKVHDSGLLLAIGSRTILR